MSEAAGKKFLEEVDARSGVTKLPSGLRFKILTRVENAGEAKSPNVGDACSVHYHGSFPDGKVFDSSMNRGSPATFAPNQVIKGWTEALQYMVEGEQWEVYLPHELAYGARGAGGAIPPYAALVFKIHLLKVLNGGKSGATAHANLEKAAGKQYAQM